jgi:hypothetical protein
VSRVIPFPAPATAPADESCLPSFAAVATAADDCCRDSLPVPLHDAVAAVRRRYRTFIAAAGRWALARGVPLPADHVALWAAAADATGCADDLDDTTGPWRASDMPHFLDSIAAWCTLAGCSPPADLAESLWHLYGFLAATGRLHPDSDSLHELRAAVVVFGTFDRLRPISLPPGPTAA